MSMLLFAINAINFGRVGIYNEYFTWMKSPNFFIMWSCEVM